MTIGLRAQASRLSFEAGNSSGPVIYSGLTAYFAYAVLYDPEENRIGLRARAPAKKGLRPSRSRRRIDATITSRPRAGLAAADSTSVSRPDFLSAAKPSRNFFGSTAMTAINSVTDFSKEGGSA